jgi:hypothetical protein
LKLLQLQKAASANASGRANKEYKILPEYEDHPLEEELNKLAQQGWVVKSTLSETEERYARIILERDVPQG